MNLFAVSVGANSWGSMKFQIRGASRETGQDLSLVIEAPNQQMAQYIANRRGILVSSISPAPPRSMPAQPPSSHPVPPTRRLPAAAPASAPLDDDAMSLEDLQPLEPLAEAPAPSPPVGVIAPPAANVARIRAPRRTHRPPKALLVAGIALICAALLGGIGWIGWTFLLRDMMSGGISSYRRFLPDNPVMAGYFNTQVLHNSSSLPQPALGLSTGLGQLALRPADLSEVFVAQAPGAQVQVFKLQSSHSMAEVAGPSPVSNYRSVPYVQSGFDRTARLDERTFLKISGPAADALLRRIIDGKDPAIGSDFQEALDACSGDVCAVETGSPLLGTRWNAVCTTVSGDQVKLRSTAAFSDQTRAEQYKSSMQSNVQNLASTMGVTVADLKVSRSGRNVTLTATLTAPSGAKGFDFPRGLGSPF